MKEEVRNQIARPLGQIPSGCFVLTARHADQSTGILASWVQQAAFEPPAVTVAVKAGRPIQPLIEASGQFVLNLIPEDRGPMFRHFGKGFAPGEPAFEGLPTRQESAGVVIESCIAHLGCRVVTTADIGDHRIYVAEVIGGALHADAKPYVHLRTNGFGY
jgi:flavin reductase (DIM6/NTAB) family NADH-FMN oxidoreductase RutF